MADLRPALQPIERRNSWVFRQAAAILESKSGSQSDVDRLHAALLNSYTRIYRGVAFDIDGTLTRGDSTDIDAEMADIIAGLLRRGVPLLLITGRGRVSTRTAVDQILSLAALHPSYLRRLRCVTHNGLFYLSTPNQLPAEPLSSQRALAKPVLCLEQLKAGLKDLAAETTAVTHITEEPSGATPYALRVLFDSPASLDALRPRITMVVRETAGEEPLHITQGSYGLQSALDISATRKSVAWTARNCSRDR